MLMDDSLLFHTNDCRSKHIYFLTNTIYNDSYSINNYIDFLLYNNSLLLIYTYN